MTYPTIWPQFFTATILNWNHLLKENEYKSIIIDFLKFLVDDKRVEVSAFIIMSNHVHIIWQPLQQYTTTQIQTSFMTYTAKTIKKRLKQDKPDILETLRVNKYDRTYLPIAIGMETGTIEYRTIYRKGIYAKTGVYT